MSPIWGKMARINQSTRCTRIWMHFIPSMCVITGLRSFATSWGKWTVRKVRLVRSPDCCDPILILCTLQTSRRLVSPLRDEGWGKNPRSSDFLRWTNRYLWTNVHHNQGNSSWSHLSDLTWMIQIKISEVSLSGSCLPMQIYLVLQTAEICGSIMGRN